MLARRPTGHLPASVPRFDNRYAARQQRPSSQPLSEGGANGGWLERAETRGVAPHELKKRESREKEGSPMFKRTLRWFIPLIALLMVAACLAFSPILSSHAAPVTPAAPTSAPSIQSHQTSDPNLFWSP